MTSLKQEVRELLKHCENRTDYHYGCGTPETCECKEKRLKEEPHFFDSVSDSIVDLVLERVKEEIPAEESTKLRTPRGKHSLTAFGNQRWNDYRTAALTTIESLKS